MNTEGEARALLASIIILTKNGGKYFRSLLDSLYCQMLIAQCEVIVIDSGSTDDTLAIADDFPAIRLIRIPPEEFGHGRTRNLGAGLAKGKFLVFLPQDATPVGVHWLASLLQPFADPSVVGAYGRQVARADASPMERYFLAHAYAAQPERKVLAVGATATLASCFFSTVSGAVRASAWAMHPFREDIIMSEDQAWSSDVMRAGHAIAYAPDAVVLHSHQYGIGDIFRRNFDSGFSIRQIFDGATGITLRMGLASLAGEAAFVLRAGRLAAVLTFLPYEAARHAGFWLGLHAHRLPRAFCRACSGLRYFWGQPRQEAQ